jgi:hypothetical protein
MRAAMPFLLAIAVGCTARERPASSAASPKSSGPVLVGGVCPPPTSPVRIDVTGTVQGPFVASLFTVLCRPLEEIADCISAVHGDAPERRGTIEVTIQPTDRDIKIVVVSGGTLTDSFRGCVVDALEVTSGEFTAPVTITLNVHVMPYSAPPTADGAQGKLELKQMKKLMRAHYPQFRACYEELRTREPDATGSVSMRFIIEENGSVTAVSVQNEGTTLTDAKMQECMRSTYARMHFPRPVGGKVTVTYPLEFP